MSTTDLDPDRIGPQVSLADVPLPARIGERLQTLYGTDDPPGDAAAWIDATRAGVEAARGRSPTVADLCTTSDGRHRFEDRRGDHAQAYVCVLDPLAYPFLTDTPGTIESTTPVREAQIQIQIDADGVNVSHPDAVVSIGVSDHVDAVDDVGPAEIYRHVCGYVHCFVDESEYETWAADAEAATTPLPVETGIGLSGAIADALFE